MTHSQILPHGFELVNRVSIIMILFPLGFEQLKSLFEDVEGSNVCR